MARPNEKCREEVSKEDSNNETTPIMPIVQIDKRKSNVQKVELEEEIRGKLGDLKSVMDRVELKDESIESLLKLSENVDLIKNEFDNYLYTFQGQIRKMIKTKTSSK